MKPGIASLYLLSTVALCNFTISPTIAQISSDGTLSTTVTTTDAINFLVENGDRAGDNLFHSFSEFSVPNLGEAYFNNATDIVNIFSRVTGGNISDIQGALRANGAANLFLINPAGIVFGENASLNIGGSFFATTAESVVFSDGIEFSATQPQEAPLLTVNITPGLQMGNNPGDITVNNTGHQLTGSFFEPITNQDPNIPTPSGLRVSSGQTLALVGGNLTLDGGIVAVPSGRVELSAIGNQNSPSQVGLQISNGQWQLTYDTLEPAGNVQLLQQALVNASGTGQGSVQIRAGNLTMADGSIVWLENRGSQAAGSIDVNIAETIDFTRAALNTILPSGIYADVSATATGRGSDINVNGNNITFREGGHIQSRTFGVGDSGEVTVNASNLNLIDSQADEISSTLGTIVVLGSGNTGDVTINTQYIRIDGAGGIAAGNFFGSGDNGNVVINASESIEITKSPSNSDQAIIGASSVSATGNAGSITINTPRLSLEGGALISSSTFGAGDSGTITINATEFVTLSGREFNLSSSTVESTSIRTAGVLLSELFRSAAALPDQVTGSGGDITINTPSLEVTDGAEIAVRHDSVGNAGTLQINADSVFLDNQGQISANTVLGSGGDITLEIQDSILAENSSSISADILDDGVGGNIDITTNNLQFNSGATISTNTTGAGNAGNINISGDNLTFDGESTGVFSEDIEGSSGDAGNINLTADLLSLTNNAQISTDSKGLGQAGTITINANRLEASRGNITATSLQTGGGNLFLMVDDLLLSNQSLISTSVLDSTGGGGNITINSEFIFARENSSISANAVFGAGGNININTDTIFIAPDSSITASSEFGVDGVVNISNPDTDNSAALLELPTDTTDVSQQIAEGCAWVKNNRFTVTGRGGVPENPANNLVNDQMWSDIRDLSSSVISHQSPLTPHPSSLIEANALMVNEQGNVELVAVVNSQHPDNALTQATCTTP